MRDMLDWMRDLQEVLEDKALDAMDAPGRAADKAEETVDALRDHTEDALDSLLDWLDND